MANINKVALLNNGKVVGAGRNKDNSNLAPIEATTTASRSYLVGDYLMLQGEFYKVIQTISIGNALVVGTNIQITSVGDEIKPKTSMQLLWNNSAPNQPYSTGTITLSSSDYDLLLFQFAHDNTNTNLISSAITEKGKNVVANEISANSSYPCRVRVCDYVSDTSYNVEIAYTGTAGASITGQSSNALIPYKVYGIKI